MALSKTNQLGVIILALRLLGKFRLRRARIISAVARRLGVSRKAGYQKADHLEASLTEREEREGRQKELRRENLLLRLHNQVLSYERDHPEVRFGQRGRHLPPDARRLAVRLLRDFKQKLSEKEIADLLEVPLSNLRRWDREADEDAKAPQKPERRGKNRHATPDDARKVVAAFEEVKKEREGEKGNTMTLEEFTQHYNSTHPQKPLDRKTISRILLAEGLIEVKTRSLPKPYHNPFEVLHPGAQVSIDASDCQVHFVGDQPQTVTLSREVGIDIATGTILGDALQTQENSDGVHRVLVQVKEECVSLLAVLSDNGSANRAGRTEACIERVSVVGHIFSFPYHPQTNGHLEGLFGQFSRVVGTIEIDDSSPQSIARSVIKVVCRIYDHFHNYSPRKRLGGMSPVEYFRRYSLPPPETTEEARAALQKRKERSDARRYPPERLYDPRFRSLVEGVLERNRIEKPLEDALKALYQYDNQAIESSSAAFYSYSHRDSFEEAKRNFAYFMGIVRKKQEEINEARAREEAAALKERRFHDELKARERKLREEKAQEEEDLKGAPERVVLNYAKLLLSGGLRLMRATFLRQLHKALKALRDLGRPRRVLEQLAATIRSWGEYGEQLKEEMIALLYAEYDALKSAPATAVSDST